MASRSKRPASSSAEVVAGERLDASSCSAAHFAVATARRNLLDRELPAANFHDVADCQLSPAPGIGLSIHSYSAVLDEGLGLATRFQPGYQL